MDRERYSWKECQDFTGGLNKPSLKTDKAYQNADIFTNPKLDETLYAAFKIVRPSVTFRPLSPAFILNRSYTGDIPNSSWTSLSLCSSLPASPKRSPTQTPERIPLLSLGPTLPRHHSVQTPEHLGTCSSKPHRASHPRSWPTSCQRRWPFWRQVHQETVVSGLDF